jgi:lipopolysaccharide assembly protein A
MLRFKRIFLGVFVPFSTLVVLTFVLENQQAASLSFLGWRTVALPVSVFVTLSLIIGLAVGPALSLLFGRKRSGLKS